MFLQISAFCYVDFTQHIFRDPSVSDKKKKEIILRSIENGN